jgi:methylene-fatty-acyl-phospholipid synthase
MLFGQLLNYKVYEKLGYQGVYYGFKFGYKIPWITTFPYNILNNPQYIGCQLTLVSIMMFYPYYEICKICCFWIYLYVITSYVEKTNYICQNRQVKIKI